MSANLSKISKRARGYEYRLILMRHAKTEAENQGGDIERQLTDKGRKQAKRVAKALKSMDLNPDNLVCSGAQRARQTADRMLKVFGDKPEVTYRKALYDQGLQAYIDVLGSCDAKVHTLMVIGHEPTVSSAAHWLSGSDSKRSYVDAIELGLSPASVALIASDDPFSDWDTGKQFLIGLFTPKDCE